MMAEWPREIRAAEELSGVRYLGPARDPLGRRGVALGFTSVEPGSTADRWRIRSELVFDPVTDALLALQARLLSNTGIPGLRTDTLLDWRVFVSSRAVSESGMPALRPRR